MRRIGIAAMVLGIVLLPFSAHAGCDAPVPPVTGCPSQQPSPTPSPTHGSTSQPAQGRVDTVELERQFFGLVNQERARRGLRSLSYSATLTDVARDHSSDMASSGRLYHNTAELRSDEFARRTGYPAMVGENVGEGPSVRWLHDAFMDSPSHRSNIIESRYTSMGIGVSVRDDTIWVTQDFIQERSPRRASFPKAAPVRIAPAPPRAAPPVSTAKVAAAKFPVAKPRAPRVSALRLPPIPAPLPQAPQDQRKPLLPLAVLATLSAVAFASRRDAGAWI